MTLTLACITITPTAQPYPITLIPIMTLTALIRHANWSKAGPDKASNPSPKPQLQP